MELFGAIRALLEYLLLVLISNSNTFQGDLPTRFIVLHDIAAVPWYNTTLAAQLRFETYQGNLPRV